MWYRIKCNEHNNWKSHKIFFPFASCLFLVLLYFDLSCNILILSLYSFSLPSTLILVLLFHTVFILNFLNRNLIFLIPERSFAHSNFIIMLLFIYFFFLLSCFLFSLLLFYLLSFLTKYFFYYILFNFCLETFLLYILYLSIFNIAFPLFFVFSFLFFSYCSFLITNLFKFIRSDCLIWCSVLRLA